MTNQLVKENKVFSLGTVSHGTMLLSDLVPTFLRELRERDEDAYRTFYKKYSGVWKDVGEGEGFIRWLSLNDNEEASWMLDDLFDALQEISPPYVYFGAHGSDYGFWPSIDSLQAGIYSGEVRSGDSLPTNPQEYETGDLFAVISDHGNVTLWERNGREWKELWSVLTNLATPRGFSFEQWERAAQQRFEEFSMDKLYAWTSRQEAKEAYKEGYSPGEFAKDVSESRWWNPSAEARPDARLECAGGCGALLEPMDVEDNPDLRYCVECDPTGSKDRAYVKETAERKKKENG